MGQRLLEDKIGTLNESASNIVLGPSRLTIGGQQYITTSNIQIAANLSSANTRYQVFAVENSGAVQLIISQNENSVGPSGYSAWKLVGSYYTGTLSQFLQFNNINGEEFQNILENISLASSGDFTTGDIKVSRVGRIVTIETIGTLSFTSDVNPVSGLGILPPWATPTDSRLNLPLMNASNVTYFAARSDGAVEAAFRNWAGTLQANTATASLYTTFTVSNSTENTPIKDL